MADEVNDVGEDVPPEPPTRASIIAEARKQVEKQRTYFRDQAEAQWTTERAQCRATAALLEISRIDDETLSPRALANAREFRELPVNKISNRGRGSKYGDKHLPERLLNAPEVDQPTRDRVTFYTGQQKQRRNLKNGATDTEEVKQITQVNNRSTTRSASSSVSSSSSRKLTQTKKSTRTFTKRPTEPYWHHLEDENAKGKKKEVVEDDPARDPNTIIAELRKLHKHAVDPNAICLRIGRQFLRLIYGTNKTAAEVLADDIANGGGGGLSSAGSGINVGDMPTSPVGVRRRITIPMNSEENGVKSPSQKETGGKGGTTNQALTPKHSQVTSPFKLNIGIEQTDSQSNQYQTPTKSKKVTICGTSKGGGLTPTSPGIDMNSLFDNLSSVKGTDTVLTPTPPDEDTKGRSMSRKGSFVEGATARGSMSRKGSFVEGTVDKGFDQALSKLEDNFALKQQRERREQLKAIELQYATEARRYLSMSMEVSDPEAVVDRRVTSQDVAAEERKLRAMAANEKVLYLKQKEWNRAKLIVQEREVQRVRIRSAAHELWLLELHLANPIQATAAMKFWLDGASGENERLASLQVLHESLSKYEKLLGDFFSANTHSLHESLGDLGDLHLSVLTQLREAFPREQHYLYALSRLESKRFGRHNQRQLMEAYVDASMADSLDQRKATKSNGYYHRLAEEKGDQSISKVARQRVVSHWQVDVREERQALNDRDDFTRGAFPSDAHLNLTHQSASTTIHSLPEGGWDERVNPNTGVSAVGFRMEDTLKAINQRGSHQATSQYLMEPSMLQNHHLSSRSFISTTSNATRQHLMAASQTAREASNTTTNSSSSATIVYQPSSSSSNYPMQATGLSHPRILQGVPTGLTFESSSCVYPVTFSAVDGSAQRSLAAQRSVQLGQSTQVTAFPRRFDPKSCDFDVKNLYSTSS